MAEQPQGFARRMMAQKLMTDARNTPGSDSPFFAGRIRPSMADIEQPTRFSDMAMPAYSTGATASLFAPGAGVADIFGGAPDPMQPGQVLPSFGENIGQGNYLDAGLQTLGAAGDVALAAGALFPPALPGAMAVGTALKAPRAAKVADAAMDAADAAKIDPNQAAGAAMDLAQARYFETGQFEPPTAENPVSVVLPTEAEPGIIAFHGSGADFDEFRLEMIGTGEGAQAYGYGLYFTDSEDIAGFYKNMMIRSVDIDGRPYIRGNQMNSNLVDEDIADDLGATNGDLEAAIKSSEGFLQEMIQADNVEAIRSTSKELEKLEQLRGRITVNDKGGKIYKVGLAPKPDKLLDYDLPLSQQPKMLKLIDDVHGDSEIIIQQAGLDPATATGGDFVKALGGIGTEQGARAASEFLAKAGIPGLKYRASGSRGAGTTDEAAERNYVIFDDKAVKILEKYGIAGPVLVTGAAVAASKAGNDNEDSGSILPDAGII